MRKETNEQLEAKIAQRKKSLKELEDRLQKQKARQEAKEDKEIVAIVRRWHKEVSAFYDTHTDIITALNNELGMGTTGTTDEEA